MQLRKLEQNFKTVSYVVKEIFFGGNRPGIGKCRGVCCLNLHNYDFAAAVVFFCLTFSFPPVIMLKYLFEVI